MNNESEAIVVYWDTSAVLSSLFADVHSPQAQYWANRDVEVLIRQHKSIQLG